MNSNFLTLISVARAERDDGAVGEVFDYNIGIGGGQERLVALDEICKRLVVLLD